MDVSFGMGTIKYMVPMNAARIKPTIVSGNPICKDSLPSYAPSCPLKGPWLRDGDGERPSPGGGHW